MEKQLITWLDEVTSTNDIIRDREYRSGDMVVAESQSAGRGQRGNSWSSPRGENLTFSLLLEPDGLPAGEQFYISKAISLALCDTLSLYDIEAKIKWPNDIYINDRKTAGILIENDLCGPSISRSIVGIGLNVNQTGFDPALPNPTSIAIAAGRTFDRTEILAAFYHALEERYLSLPSREYGSIDCDYISRLYRFGEEHPFADGRTGERFQGTITAVKPSGELLVRHRDGHTEGYLFKEIEYIL